MTSHLCLEHSTGDLRPASVPPGYTLLRDGDRYGCQFIVYRDREPEVAGTVKHGVHTEKTPRFGCLACWIVEDADRANRVTQLQPNNEPGPRLVGFDLPYHLQVHMTSHKHFEAVKVLTGKFPEVRFWKCLLPTCGRMYLTQARLKAHWSRAHAAWHGPLESNVELFRSPIDARPIEEVVRSICTVTHPASSSRHTPHYWFGDLVKTVTCVLDAASKGYVLSMDDMMASFAIQESEVVRTVVQEASSYEKAARRSKRKNPPQSLQSGSSKRSNHSPPTRPGHSV